MQLDRDYAALRDENERLLEECRLNEAREQAEWQKQRDDRKRLAAAAMREARDWPDAFGKQKTLIRQELAIDPEIGDPDNFFTNALAANARAEVLFREKMQAVEELRRRLLDEMALQIEEEFRDKSGITDLVERLRADDPGGYVNW